MLKTIIVLPDGTEISSGVSTGNAVQSCTYTECVNSGTELTIGSVCAAMLEVKFITPDGGLQIAAGDEFVAYKDDGNTRHKLGVFIAEKPTRPTAHTMKLTAYDRVSLLDRDLTRWLSELTGWPYSLFALATLVCEACGLELTNTEIPNGSYLVQRFSADRITGRQLMQWIGEAAAQFCRATADGQLEFGWYTPCIGNQVGTTPMAAGDLNIKYDSATGTLTMTDESWVVEESDGALSITASNLSATESGGSLALTGTGDTRQHYYFMGGLTFQDYTVAPIEKVQIRANDSDVGTVYPQEAGEKNTYIIQGNPMLIATEADDLQYVAQAIFEQLAAVSYTPCTVSIPATFAIRAGHILSITDRNGRVFSAYIMAKKQNGMKDTLESTGSHRRDSTSAVNEQSYAALSGKVMNLRTDVEGIRAENKAADGRMAALALTVDGINTQVQQQANDADGLRSHLTVLEQTANAVKISVQSMQENGVSKVQTGMGYTFNDEGMKISRTGEQMENKLDNTGMYVTREGETILQANNDGVVATDVRVKNYLRIGDNSRFEDYGGNRTACFYVGG